MASPQPATTPPPGGHGAIRFGDLEIDSERYLVTVAGRRVQLSYMQFQVLLRVARGEGRIVTYEQLSRAVWGDSSSPTRRRLAVLISRIRSRLGDGAAYIDTVRRVGYRLASPAAGGPTPQAPYSPATSRSTSTNR